MESRIHALQKLVEQFAFENFCVRTTQVKDFPDYCGVDAPNLLAWKARVGNVIRETVESNSAPVRLLEEAENIVTENYPRERFERQKTLMVSALEKTIEIANDDVFAELKHATTTSSSAHISNRVFVVHGHDNQTKTDLEIFLVNIGMEPIVLHRQPDQGRTIIEKLEEHSDVGFAFILLTPDEIAYTVDQKDLVDTERTNEYRARPNVIFEFGYFAGKLTRRRVCCLIKGDVSRPSDIEGIGL